MLLDNEQMQSSNVSLKRDSIYLLLEEIMKCILFLTFLLL